LTPICSSNFIFLLFLFLVIDKKKFVGFITANDIRSHLADKSVTMSSLVESLMHRFAKRKQEYQPITPETPLSSLESFFERHPVGFVTDTERIWCLGVVTKYDLRAYLQQRGGL
jgi:CBS domain-containing protein